MERQQFKKFCEKEFELQGFKKKKNMFYLKGVDLLCRINLQKSNYGNVYYVNYQYFTPVYNFINGRLSDKPTVLKPLS